MNRGERGERVAPSGKGVVRLFGNLVRFVRA